MWQRALLLGLLLLLALAAQMTVFHYLSVGGALPDLMLLFALMFALRQGPRSGLAVGVAAGLLQDLTTGTFLGLNALTIGTVAFLMGLVQQKIFRENVAVPVLSSIIGSLLRDGMSMFFLAVFGVEFAVGRVFLEVSFPAALYNGALAPLLYSQLFATDFWLRNLSSEG